MKHRRMLEHESLMQASLWYCFETKRNLFPLKGSDKSSTAVKSWVDFGCGHLRKLRQKKRQNSIGQKHEESLKVV